VDLVDEEDGVGIVHQLLQHRLQALLEIAAILGAGQQRTHVECVDVTALEHFRDVALDDAARKAFRDGGLAHPRLAHQQWIVLATAAQRLDHALDFLFAADQRVDLAGQGHRVKVECVVLECAARRGFLLGLRLVIRFGLRGLRHLGDAVRDEVDDVEARHPLLVQEIHRMRILLAENRHQHVGAGHFLLAGGLHVEDRALDHALEAERGLGVRLLPRQHRRVFGHELGQELAQFVDIGGAGAQHLRGRGIVEQRQQQVLHGDELVALLAGLHEGHVQADFQFLGDHVTFLP